MSYHVELSTDEVKSKSFRCTTRSKELIKSKVIVYIKFIFQSRAGFASKFLMAKLLPHPHALSL